MLLDRGAWTSLMIQSPWYSISLSFTYSRGELPTGGRSSQHQWNEAVQVSIPIVNSEGYRQSHMNYMRNTAKKLAIWWQRKLSKGQQGVFIGVDLTLVRLALHSVRRWRSEKGKINRILIV